eukprot:scaffold59689_cov80-Cyclotella_meneghiniana.AAC.3
MLTTPHDKLTYMVTTPPDKLTTYSRQCSRHTTTGVLKCPDSSQQTHDSCLSCSHTIATATMTAITTPTPASALDHILRLLAFSGTNVKVYGEIEVEFAKTYGE